MGKSLSDGFYFAVGLCFDAPQIQNLYGDLFVLYLIDSSVDLGKGSFTNLLKNVIIVNFDVFEVFIKPQIIFVGKLKFTMFELDLFI